MIVKTHSNRDGRNLLAVCDDGLLGKKFEDGKKQLDLTGEFYNGTKLSEKEILDLMRNSDMLNLVGKRCVGLALGEGLIQKDNITYIKNIPHAQTVLVQE